MNSRQVIELLRKRHIEDLFVEECKDGPTQTGHHRRLDAWVMSRSWVNFRTYGYEVKVSRSDFLGDQKMTDYIPLCNCFYVVCPAGVVKSENELPDEAGLLLVTSNETRLITKRRAKFRQIEDPINLYRYILMARTQIVRTTQYIEEDRLAYWRNWLDNKTITKDLGHRVSKNLARSIKKTILDVQEENKRLKEQNDGLLEVKQKIEALGLSPDSPRWSLIRELDKHKNGYASEVELEIQQVLYTMRNATRRLEELQAIFEKEKA